MTYEYAPGYGVIFNYLVSVKGQQPGDVDWEFFTHRNSVQIEYYHNLCKEHNLTEVIEKARLIVSKDLIKAAFLSENNMFGEYYEKMDYFTELANASWGAFESIFLRDDAKYQTIIDFHANITKNDPMVGHLAGKPFAELTESDVLDLLLVLNPFFNVLTDYIADWDEEPYGKLKFCNNIFYSSLMTYANGKSTVTVIEELFSDPNKNAELKSLLGEKKNYISELKERMEAKGVYPDITAEKAKEWGLIYDVENGEVIIKKCASRDMSLIIPKTIDGVPVKQIKNSIQWSSLSKIMSAIVFADLDYICDYAFSQFPDLTSIALLGKVDKVGANFAEKTNVEKTEKEGVNYIRVNDNSYYMAVGYNKNVADIVHLDKDTKFITSFAFMNAPIKSIIMPNIVGIGKLAFSSCKKLEYIDFPDTLKYIDERAFSMCTKLNGVNVNVEEISDAAFYSCDCLKDFRLGSSTKKIGFEAFGDTDLFDFEIPESVESFNSGMFGSDSRIQQVYIPGNRIWKNEKTGQVYEPDDFYDPSDTADIILYADDAVFTVVATSPTRVDFEKSEKMNPDATLQKERTVAAEKPSNNDLNITEVKEQPKPTFFDEEVPDEIKHISNEEANAQGYDTWVSPYTGLFTINSIETTSEVLNIPISIGGQTVKSIGRSSVKDNEHIKKVNIYGYVNVIGSFFLCDCPNVTSVTVKEGVGEIDFGFLKNNPHLITEKDDVIYANVNGNPYYVAVGCNKEADTLFVEEDCEIIANFAFEDSNAKRVTIPNAKVIGKNAFKNCKNLTKVGLSKDAQILENCFEGSESASVVKF